MEKFKRKITELWQDKKKRKGAIIAVIVIATVIASVTTITITGVNSLSGDEATSVATTNGTSVDAQSMLPGNITGNNPKENASSQFDPTKPAVSGNQASVKTSPEGTGEVSKGALEGGESRGDAGHINDSSDSQNGSTVNEPVIVECSVAIDCSSISGNGTLTAAGKPWLEPYAANPSILPSVSIRVLDANGDGRVGVDEALKEACNSYGIQYEFKGSSYLKGMNYLYEFDAGKNSGWMYSVNGTNPNRGCNSYYLSGGEDILWYYVISY